MLLQNHDDDYKDNGISVEMITDLTFMKCMGTKLLDCVADPAMRHSYPLTQFSHVFMVVSVGPTGMPSDGTGAQCPGPAPARGNSFLYHLRRCAVNQGPRFIQERSGRDLNESSESLPSHVELIDMTWDNLLTGKHKYTKGHNSNICDGLKTWLQILSHLSKEGM